MQNLNIVKNLLQVFNNCPLPQKNIKTTNDAINYLITLFDYIKEFLKNQQYQCFVQKDELQQDLLFYRDMTIPQQYIKRNIYNSLIEGIESLQGYLQSSWTKNFVVKILYQILLLVRQYQDNILSFYQPFLENDNSYDLIQNTKYNELYEKVLKKIIIQNQFNTNKSPTDILQIIVKKEFIKLVKQKEIVEMYTLYDKLYFLLSQSKLIKHNLLTPEYFWTKPEVIQILHIYLYNDEIDLTISSFLCSKWIYDIIYQILNILNNKQNIK